MNTISTSEMKKIDEWAISDIGIPQMVLMENAGFRVAEAIGEASGRSKDVCVVCGKGNNGGDGLVTARRLKNKGSNVSVFIIGAKSDLKGSAKQNLDIVQKTGIETIEIIEKADIEKIRKSLLNTDVVVDAIFGTGLKEDVEGICADVIELINKTKIAARYLVVSADAPSGIDCDTGQVKGICIDADITVTFHLPKIGMIQYPAILHIGKLVVADIGIPYQEILNSKSEIRNSKREIPNVTDVEFVRKNMPARRVQSNKGDYGRILIIAGSEGMAGAAILSSRAALRTGAGLVYLSVPAKIQNIVNAATPEVITLPDITLAKIKKMKIDVIAIGPGLGLKRKDYVAALIKADLPVPMIIDADALNSISSNPGILKKRTHGTVITPHPGEMARLLKTTPEKIQSDRINIALKTASDWNTVVVLKGAYTVTASPEGKHFVNASGNPGMASAGVGDVLTGIISGFIGQGSDPFIASVIGTYIHGLSGDIIASMKGERGLFASDIIETLPYVMKSIMT